MTEKEGGIAKIISEPKGGGLFETTVVRDPKIQPISPETADIVLSSASSEQNLRILKWMIAELNSTND